MFKAIALCALAGAAHAADDGDIVFVDLLTDTINMVNAPLDTTALVTVARPTGDSRLGDIVRVGGSYYVGDGHRPEGNPSTGAIWRIDDLFGTPSASIFSESDPVQNPIGMVYSRSHDQFLVVNNPVSQTLPNHVDGVLAVDGTTGASQVIFNEDPQGPRPRYQAGVQIAANPNGDDWFVTSRNGGSFVSGNGDDDVDFGSMLHRMTVDGNLATTMENVVDLSDTSATGLANPLTLVRGVLAMPGTNDVYITDGGDDSGSTGAIYRISLDNNGDFQSITPFATGFGSMGEIVYNQFDDTFVFGAGNGQLMQINTDGTGLTLLAENIVVRGIHIVPAPGALAMLGLGVAAIRRRR